MATHPSTALIKRELLIPSRSKWQFALFLLLILGGAWVIVASWPATGNVVWSNLSYASSQILIFLSVLLLCSIGLIVPGVAANAILGERLTGTWDGLSLTLMRPSGIVAAKLFSVIARYLIVIAALGPIFGAVTFLTGFDWRQIACILVLLVCTTTTCAAIGLGCSATFRGMTGAIIASYGLMLMLMGLPIFLLAIIAETGNNSGWLDGWLEANLWALSPLAVLGTFLAGEASFSYFYIHLAYQALYLLAGLLFTWFGIRRLREPRAESNVRKPLFPSEEEQEDDRQHEKLIRDGRNPVYVRERKWGGAMARRRGLILAPLAFGLFLAISGTVNAINTRQNDAGVVIMSIITHGVILCCIIPALFANTFSKERELKNLDMLRATLLTPVQVVWGKFHAALSFFTLMWCMSLLANFPSFLRVMNQSLYTGAVAPPPMTVLILGHVTIFTAGVIALAITLCISILARRTVTAIVLSQVSVFMVMAGFFLLTMLVLATAGVNISEEFITVMIFASPALWHFSWMNNSIWERFGEYTPYALFHDTLSLLIAAALFYLAVLLYNKREMQQS